MCCVVCFENKVFEIEQSGSSVGTDHDKGLYFLLTLNAPKLLKSLITKVNNNQNYFDINASFGKPIPVCEKSILHFTFL